MIKVLQVCSDTNIGGAGKCILTYLKFCDKFNFETAVVLPKGSLLGEKVREIGFEVIEIDGMADKSLDLSAIKKLLRVYRDFAPDVVHTHGSMSARIAARLYGAKIVYTRHTVYPPSPRLTHGLGKLISGISNNLTADRIIAVAEAAKDNIISIGVNPKKIEVILNGVEKSKEYSPSEIENFRKEYGIPDGIPSTAIIARLDEIKGHRYFIEGAKILKDDGIDAKFFIAGTGPMENEIREQISRLGLSGTVIMLGFLDDISPLLNVIDVQSNCSTTEATSLSLLEGMSLGKPAVVSDAGGNPAVILDGKNGFVFPGGDAKIFAESLKKLFQNKDLYHEMSRNSTEIYSQKFTASKYAENIEKIYSSLGGKKNE